MVENDDAAKESPIPEGDILDELVAEDQNAEIEMDADAMGQLEDLPDTDRFTTARARVDSEKLHDS